MSTYVVHVIIENKPNISDPEGDTILNDLVLKSKNSSIKKNPCWKNTKIYDRSKWQKKGRKNC